jgi:hypothetical protein
VALLWRREFCFFSSVLPKKETFCLKCLPKGLFGEESERNFLDCLVNLS